ncbi:MAG: hypothetical protein GC159_13945 [Phycisphaera sp.]|nr:hypothetical protein [Phycisphaera sp.]
MKQFISGIVLGLAVTCVVALVAVDVVEDLHEDADTQEDVSPVDETVLDPVYLDDPMLDQRIVIVAGDIHANSSNATMTKLLYLNSLDPKKPIDLYIKTLGGWEDDAYAIVDTIQRIDAPVNTWAVGECDSAGAIIVASGTGKRRAMPNTLLMYHAVPYEGDVGPSGAVTRQRDRNDRYWHRVAKIPQAWFDAKIDTEFYMSPEQAIEYGVIDEIYQRPASKP